MPALEISAVGKHRGLVEKHPIRNSVAQRLRDHLHVVRITARSVTIRPSAGVAQSLRQVPVKQRDEWANVRLKQRIDNSAVIFNPFRIRGTNSRGLNTWPGNRKTVAVQIHRLPQRDIFAPAMIRIASGVTGVAVLHLAWRVREAIPDRFALAVLIPCAFDLIRSRSRAPEKSLGKHDLSRIGKLTWRHQAISRWPRDHRARFGGSGTPREQRGQSGGSPRP